MSGPAAFICTCIIIGLIVVSGYIWGIQVERVVMNVVCAQAVYSFFRHQYHDGNSK